MKKIFSILFTLIIVGFSTSCKNEFLEVVPKTGLSEATLANKAGVNYLLIGAYSLLDGVQTNVGSPNADWHGSADNWIYGEVNADNAYKGSTSGDQPEISFIEQKQILPDNTHFRGKWRAVYDGVARSNDVIQMTGKAKDMTDAEKTSAIAQARFLRGHYHFEAKKMWNMAPYIDDKTYNSADANSTKVPNDKDIWANIEEDLKFAYDNLPTRWAGEPGRATKWAAAAMLGKAYMFQKKFAQAKTLFDAIVASGQYRLMDRYHDNFRTATNNNAESIFEVQHSVNDGAAISNNGNRGATLNYPYGGQTTCCGFFQPSQNLVNAFKVDANGLPLFDTFNNAPEVTSETTSPLDPRLDWTVGRIGLPYLDWGTMTPNYIRDMSYAGPYSPKKNVPYASDIAAGWTGNGNNPRFNANNYRMIRYAHVLLMLAEAEAELGNLERARELVNQIRRRAANPDGFVRTASGAPAANYRVGTYDTPWTSKEFAINAVRFETRLELAMEGHRFFDLVRWGIAAPTLNAYYAVEGTRRAYLRGVQFTANKHEYFPIPLQEIVNSQLKGQPTLKQNPGY
ncbi:RagB/SusD family nutrient uptake outer membrane protein [Thermoflexibacter ruber]|uniref:Starch-binding associating with outer membrane n=1 Tax=Thermoflexibacter ruber TaxID=1003 RepID=A0A1I2B5U2_9BACT|nr:RagB/SusD family nutrient uptake outer membrane protein [Thermoflexibacter ruber]SFE51572.1 Starch-binding associating with outer membrane [Thermoflexibacter ruber]